MTTLKHRTLDGKGDYTFSLEYGGNGYRAYIVQMPSYGNRNSSLHVTHRLLGTDNRYYICWSSPLHSLEDAKKVISLWSETTQAYITTGRTIDAQIQLKEGKLI